MISIMTVRANDKLKEELKQRAAQMGFTRNALILNILWEWVDRQDAVVQLRKSSEQNA